MDFKGGDRIKVPACAVKAVLLYPSLAETCESAGMLCILTDLSASFLFVSLNLKCTTCLSGVLANIIRSFFELGKNCMNVNIFGKLACKYIQITANIHKSLAIMRKLSENISSWKIAYYYLFQSLHLQIGDKCNGSRKTLRH